MSKITGINHILLICKDMNKTVEFFANILGMPVKGTAQKTMNVYPGAADSGAQVRRLYFFDAGNGTSITCAEAPASQAVDSQPILPAYWPGEPKGPVGKVDHLALNVESRDDLVYFQKRLREHGVTVSEISERMTSPKFVKSIYFHSPDGFPMEIATWDWADPTWAQASKDNYMTDPDPVPSLKTAGT